jgi:hypothetical protein
VPRFWQAYDQISSTLVPAARVAALQKTYLDPGTTGLRAWANDFAVTPASLVDSVDSLREYYDGVRAATLDFPDASVVETLRAVFCDWEAMYPKAKFPDVYWIIGNTQTAATVTSAGMIIGTESVARRSADIQNVTPNYLLEADLSRETLPLIVSHELAHAQQKYYPGPKTVLFWVILEGGAELLSELVTGRIVHENLRAYGVAHAAELWAELQATRNDLGKGGWFAAPTSNRPGALGYYVGYAIAKSYYERASNPAQALDDILNIDDYDEFLQESGYGSQFE